MKWQEIIRANITTADQLRGPLKLTDDEYERIRDELETYPMSVTEYYLSLIDPDDPADPIRKMAIPAGIHPSFNGELDTSGENSNTKMQGLQHKYLQTAMILISSECAMYCRHCFRRRLVGKETEEIATDVDGVVEYLKAHPTINNVLLSGGDAFVLPTERIAMWLDRMTTLEQLDFIRFGTRTPVTFPQRILEDPALLDTLVEHCMRKQIYVVTHFNHPNEVTLESRAAVKALQAAGLVVKNQTVLMSGINDDPEVLGKLLRMISGMGIVQHYIFQCRPVHGVKSRFQVPIREGLGIVQAALAMQNGLGKSADYAMSHVTGKMRILGELDGKIVFQYKQAKDPANIGKMFTLDMGEKDTWLPEDFDPTNV